MELNILELTQVFLVPGSILVGALGVSKTEGLKTGVSTLGLLTAVFWMISNWDAYTPMAEAHLRVKMLTFLPALFVVCWLIAGVIHFRKWQKLGYKG